MNALDAIRNVIGRFLGYGACQRCGRSWWYVEMGRGVEGPITWNEAHTAGSSMGFRPLCVRCESETDVRQWPSAARWLRVIPPAEVERDTREVKG